ncbi:hypothetical protein [Vannielia litorea]|uniref:hypothetical protein n=1 Tax=Vannielia litorea TaxID=1217970 RepID=UPI001C985DCC|nr:hypothetical protein [Vannielia litorea]MBY6046828.1 hypothetical protein [Vannielia litorea]MBY6074242.1 hypothetical protein [Vannielia litorea]
MKRLIHPTVALALALSLGGTAASANVKISCKRGPLPKVAIINGPAPVFINSIEKTYAVTPEQARAAAEYVCADMDAVGDAEKLRSRTRAALANYRRR